MLFHKHYNKLFLKLKGVLSSLILREFCNLLLILFVVIQLFRQLLWGLELLAWLLLLLLLSEQGVLLKRGLKRRKQKRLLRKDAKAEKRVRRNLEGCDLEILRKHVLQERAAREKEKLLEVEDLVRGRLDIAEKVLKENSRL